MTSFAEIELQINKYKEQGLSLFSSSSFQTHSTVLLHLISRIDKKIPVYFLHTGFHFPETIIYKNQITELFGINTIDLKSSTPKLMQVDEHGKFLFTSDPDYCCYLNKIQPLEPALDSFDVWINGVRADQNSNRANFNMEEKTNHKAFRFHPMLEWTNKMIYAYIREFNIPKHPLDEKGYLSVGCEPCTRKIDPELMLDERQARWYGMNKTECGLHTELIKKMNILITGGAGYIGFALAEKLAENPAVDKIVLYDNLSRHNENVFFGKLVHPEKFHLVRADILDGRKLNNALKNIDIVYHLAAKVITPFANQDPHFFEQINHWGTSELVDAVEKNSIKKLIYLSSASVYDRIVEEATEDTIPNPNTYYGISKLRGEEHIHRLLNTSSKYIIRCGNVYGYSKSMRFDAVINNFMLQANFENKISIHGTGAQTRAFIHIENAAEALSKLVDAEIPSGTFNLVTKNLAVNDIAEAVLELYPSCERIFVNQHLNLGSIKVSVKSTLWEHISINENSLLEELLAFKEKFAFARNN